MSATHVYALPFGATLLDSGRTRFRFWAPAQPAVHLALDRRGPLPMQAAGDGWFECEAECGAGQRYRYLLDDGLAVPDPAARAQAGDWSEPSLVVDPAAYRWRCEDWRGRPWPETVIYELHAGLCGGYAGVIEKIRELTALGVTALELMPLAEFPGARNWGYDGVLPYAPEASYGSPGQLKQLVDSAHAAGLMVFLDVVYNHFGPEGNFLARYAPQFFRADRATPWGAALNFRCAELREFFAHNALYWLMEYRFDGLRLDAVHAIEDFGWLEQLATRVRAQVEPGREVHLMLENVNNEARLLGQPAAGAAARFDAQWNDDAHNATHVLLTGEQEGYYADFAEAPLPKLTRCLSEGFAFQGEPAISHDGQPRGSASAGLPPTAFIFFLQNHDQIGNRAFGERLTRLIDRARLRAARALQLLCPQIPLLFMDEDWDSRRPFLYFTDYRGELAQAVREGRRREFAKFRAFADPAARGRIPDPNARRTYERSRPLPAGHRARSARAQAEYRKLLRLRAEHIVPRLAGARSLGAESLGRAALVARWRLGDGARLTLAGNFDASPQPLALPPRASCIYATRRLPRAGDFLPAASTAAFLEVA